MENNMTQRMNEAWEARLNTLPTERREFLDKNEQIRNSFRIEFYAGYSTCLMHAIDDLIASAKKIHSSEEAK